MESKSQTMVEMTPEEAFEARMDAVTQSQSCAVHQLEKAEQQLQPLRDCIARCQIALRYRDEFELLELVPRLYPGPKGRESQRLLEDDLPF